MNKEQVLHGIRKLAAERVISHDEVNQAFYGGLTSTFSSSTTTQAKKNVVESFFSHLSISRVLYMLGSLVVVVGVLVLIGQNWSSFSPVVRVLVTLGTGVAFYISAVALSREEKFSGASTAFFIISMILIPLGIFITLYEAGYQIFSESTHMLWSAIITCICAASFVAFKRTFFLFFSFLWGTWLLYSTIFFFLGDIVRADEIVAYIVMLVGVIHLSLGFFLERSSRQSLTSLLYTVAALQILVSGITLSGLWDALYPFVVLILLGLGVYIRTRILLMLSSLFLAFYIFKITAKYFSSSIGWPLSLIIIGFVLVGVGYVTVYLNKKYMGA